MERNSALWIVTQKGTLVQFLSVMIKCRETGKRVRSNKSKRDNYISQSDNPSMTGICYALFGLQVHMQLRGGIFVSAFSLQETR